MILVVGGTGRLGSQVVAGLLAAGHSVRTLSRGVRPVPSSVEAAEHLVGSVTDAATVRRAVEGTSAVVSAMTGFPFQAPERVDAIGSDLLGTTAHEVGADLVALSVAGAEPHSVMGLHRAKFAAEQAIERSGVRATIIRPDAFADLWLDLMAETATRSHRPLVFGRGDNPIGWVAVRDVCALVLRAVEDRDLRGQCLTICGPEHITMTDLARRVMAAREWPGEPRHVPELVLRLASNLPGRAGRQAEGGYAMGRLPTVVDDARDAVPGLPLTPLGELLAQGRPGAGLAGT